MAIEDSEYPKVRSDYLGTGQKMNPLSKPSFGTTQKWIEFGQGEVENIYILFWVDF